MTDSLLTPERTMLFIDGSNLYASSKALGFDIDYKKLLAYFQKGSTLIRANYYTALLDNNDEFNSIKPLIDFLDYNGFNVISKPAKEFTDFAGRRKIKGNMDIELAVGLMDAAIDGKLEHAIVFSGDGDFRSVVESIQRRGVRVTAISTMKSDPPMIADELRRQVDQYIELEDLKPHISRSRDPNYIPRQRYVKQQLNEEYEEGYEPVGISKITKNA